MNKSSYGKSLIVLILGTIFSVIVSVLLANQFPTPYQYIIGLLSEIIVISLSLAVFVFEINYRVLSNLHDKDIFVAAGEYAIKSNDSGFSEKYKLIKHQLIELSKGHYELDDLPSVYADDIESIKALKKGDKLHSMCPISGPPEKASRQFSNKSFIASMSQHYKAANDDVIVQRLYIFQSSCLLEDVPECKAHLDEAKAKGLDVRLIFLDDPRYQDAKRLPHDFIIFGNHKVSIGRLGPDSPVDGADVWASRDKIDEYKQKYEQLIRQSEPYQATG